MCGIAGGIALQPAGEKYTSRIREAISCINHRGPDGDGVFQQQPVALGHKRLSIIDTSTAANQPMFSADGRYAIVFNGEIFNYQELARTHFPGHHFKTSSDTEVFLELFHKMGDACFAELRGFFAAAIYDNEKKELIIARDRYGKKPLHLYQDEDVVLFASELKSLVAFGIPKEIDWEVLPYYFQLNYIPQPLGILKKVRKLEAGHFLRIHQKGIEEKAYYQLQIRQKEYATFTYEKAKKRLFDLMEEATRLRLIADVPLGAFLSGGIDSSVVVALASRHKQALNTFSIGYKDNPFFDETQYANLVAKKFNTEHTVFSLTSQDFLEHIDDVLNFMDEPFADSSAIPTYILSKRTRRFVTVALSGDGGDEVFAGYNKYSAEWNMMQPSFKKNLVKGLAPVWKALPKSRNNKVMNRVRQLNRFAEAAGLSAGDRYWQWASILPAAGTMQLFSSRVTEQIKGTPLSERFPWSISGQDLNEVLLADMKLVLPGDMLVKVDMMSMANSLEIRSPFLDQEVVEFAFGLPSEYKLGGGLKKRIVQDTFRELLPAALYNRPKQGFDVPLLGWFRNEMWSRIDKDLLSDHFIAEQGIFNPDSIRSLKKKLHARDSGDSHETIWALMVFQHWWKKTMA